MRRVAVAVVVAVLLAVVSLWATDYTFDDFEAELRSYYAIQIHGNQTLTRVANSTPIPHSESWVIESISDGQSCSGGGCNFSSYFDFQPWQSAQGDRFFYERSLGGWPADLADARALEFWIVPDATTMNTGPHTAADFYNGGVAPPNGSQGYYGQSLQLGTYIMAPSQRGNCTICLESGQSAQEGGGNHHYHTVPFPNSGGIPIKMKYMRPTGTRANGGPPVYKFTRATTNATPFSNGETISCSPSGASMVFASEIGTSIYAYWTDWQDTCTASDTLTGQSSGAERTVSTAAWHQLAGSEDTMGAWSNFTGTYMMDQGGTWEWFTDTASYWSRLTRIYWEVLYTPDQADMSLRLGDLRMTTDTRDDYVAVATIGAYYDSGAGKLWVGFEKNAEMDGKEWQIRTSADDILTNGWASGTAWQTITDGGQYGAVTLWENFTPPADNFYIAIRNMERATFAQLYYDPEEPAPPPPGQGPSGPGVRGRRVLVR